MCVFVGDRGRVCVCVGERERVCMCMRESVCVYERERESVCVCVAGDKGNDCLFLYPISHFLHLLSLCIFSPVLWSTAHHSYSKRHRRL